MHIIRDYNNSRFTKVARISPDDLAFVNAVKGKKSTAGKLSEIISFYRESKHLENK